MVMNGVAPVHGRAGPALHCGGLCTPGHLHPHSAQRVFIKRAHDRNMDPYPASAAVYRAEFNIEVPVGTRFSCEDLNFVVTARMDTEDDTETGLSHQVTCETLGAVANGYGGTPPPRWVWGPPPRAGVGGVSIPTMMRRKRRLSAKECWTVSSPRPLVETRPTTGRKCWPCPAWVTSKYTPYGTGDISPQPASFPGGGGKLVLQHHLHTERPCGRMAHGGLYGGQREKSSRWVAQSSWSSWPLIIRPPRPRCWRKSRRPLTQSRTPGRAWAWLPSVMWCM